MNEPEFVADADRLAELRAEIKAKRKEADMLRRRLLKLDQQVGENYVASISQHVVLRRI